MDKRYYPQEVEKKIYHLWEKGGYFTPKINPTKKPFSIILPLPNASDPLHMGHALFTIEDIMIRYHKMLGEPTLWLPGGDHAGIETQFVFEKKLAKEGKSRFDFDRNTLFKMIKEFVEKNKDINKNQMKQLGFSLDWTRYHYSLEPEIVEKVFETFKKLHNDNLVYRGERLVHYCTKCGTAFSDLEIRYVEKDDTLYYLDYGPIQIATARPETIFADTAVAVNPKDKRFKGVVGKEAIIPLINKKILIIEDEAIQIDFGTGALKVTPAHDEVDYEIGQRHELDTIEIIDWNGRMKNVPEKYMGLKFMRAREMVIEDLKQAKKLVKTKPLHHSLAVCYRCDSTIEPLLMPQWYVKTKPLAKPAIEAVKKGKTKIVPKKRFEKMYFGWLENIRDWNISRQVVWGPRIPVWYKVDHHASNIWVAWIDSHKKLYQGTLRQFLEKGISLNEIKNGLQRLVALSDSSSPEYVVSTEEPKDGEYIQETDTFDTWFLSSQWPVNTLKSKPGDFEYFYPTSVLDTLWDILFFWVARMMMMGIYLTGEVPFKIIHLHARVVDKFGKKMSKSKENVVNPIGLSDKYGADALRMALIFGTAPASDISIGDEKVKGMRNFCNKIWNASRFILSYKSNLKSPPFTKASAANEDDQFILAELNKTIKTVTQKVETYYFGQAAEILYDFFWHKFCDVYIEKAKTRRDEAQPVLLYVLEESLKLLHPFMPFITEEIWQKLKKGKSLIVSSWPKS